MTVLCITISPAPKRLHSNDLLPYDSFLLREQRDILKVKVKEIIDGIIKEYPYGYVKQLSMFFEIGKSMFVHSHISLLLSDNYTKFDNQFRIQLSNMIAGRFGDLKSIQKTQGYCVMIRTEGDWNKEGSPYQTWKDYCVKEQDMKNGKYYGKFNLPSYTYEINYPKEETINVDFEFLDKII